MTVDDYLIVHRSESHSAKPIERYLLLGSACPLSLRGIDQIIDLLKRRCGLRRT